jgi:hypothetical protein
MALDDHHSIVATMLSAIPSAMEATIMFAILELGAGAAKIALPIAIVVTVNIPIMVAIDPNAEFLCAGYGRGSDRNRRERSKSKSKFLHSVLLVDPTKKTVVKQVCSVTTWGIF